MNIQDENQVKPAQQSFEGLFQQKLMKNIKPEKQIDRFIPNRKSTITTSKRYFLQSKENIHSNNVLSQDQPVQTDQSQVFNKLLTETLLGNQNRIISFRDQKPKPLAQNFRLQSNICLDQQGHGSNHKTKIVKRIISQTPEKILDAPELRDDYYLNLLDWGKNGLLAISLDQNVYLWNYHSGDIKLLLSTLTNDNYISSVSWMNQGNILAVGFSNNLVQLWDTCKQVPVQNLVGHTGRVCSLSWSQSVLSSGSRDSMILNHDIRTNQVVAKLIGHQQEVCGLKWSPDGTQLASGSNDNNLLLWDLATQRPRARFNDHRAAVKALSWCPWQRNLLVSGGGTADKTMKFWDTMQDKLVKSIDVDSQICSILWSNYTEEFVSSHGFSKNQLCVWNYKSMQVITELQGHSNRVLHMALSPDGTTVCSAASDETLRFWKIFERPDNGYYPTETGYDLLQLKSLSLR